MAGTDRRLGYAEAEAEAWAIEAWHEEVLEERRRMQAGAKERLRRKYGEPRIRPLEDLEIPGFFESDEELEEFIADVRRRRNESIPLGIERQRRIFGDDW